MEITLLNRSRYFDRRLFIEYEHRVCIARRFSCKLLRLLLRLFLLLLPLLLLAVGSFAWHRKRKAFIPSIHDSYQDRIDESFQLGPEFECKFRWKLDWHQFGYERITRLKETLSSTNKSYYRTRSKKASFNAIHRVAPISFIHRPFIVFFLAPRATLLFSFSTGYN